MRVILIALAGASLAACVSTTEPVDMGNGVYMIATNARGGLKSDGELAADTIRQAHAFCQRTGKKAVVETASSSGTQGWTPQNTKVAFRCE